MQLRPSPARSLRVPARCDERATRRSDRLVAVPSTAGRHYPVDVAWLEALIWPEHHHRDRLRAAAIAAADPPTPNRGDLVDDLPSPAAQAPADATPVVSHTSVLCQVPTARRTLFVNLVRGLPGHRIDVEAPDVLSCEGLPPAPDETLHGTVGRRTLGQTTPRTMARAHEEDWRAWLTWAMRRMRCTTTSGRLVKT
ncbi:hypothetical protein MCAG_02577 [Micromonospora sp. ATCC 39149]|uniref:DUF2332 family protein n=1 Tax=Micromonospora carbonacea TaxID=47853 RepID=A0A7D6CDV6_9ACTN|nr:hypothetical protein MCAG_02577 [Micromonospora sp. ATCC 39149]QLJ98429.1 DUF2332 family protein [Micromonospora carbonacea]